MASGAASPPVCVAQHPHELGKHETLQNQSQAEGEEQGYGNDSKRSETFHTFPMIRETMNACKNPLMIEEHCGNPSVNRVSVAGIAGERP